MAHSRLTLDFLKDLLREEYSNVNITDFVEAPGSKRGDNYTAMLYRIHLKGTKKEDAETENEDWNSSLIYKCLPESLFRREAFRSDALFCNEVAFYTKIIPALLEFQQEHAEKIDSPFEAVPRCYLAQNDLVILEDLQNRNFRMSDRRAGLTTQQCYAVLRVLAHFHALSLAMKKQYPEKFHELLNLQDGISEGLFDTENEEWYRGYYRAASRNALAMVKEELPSEEDRDKYLSKFSEFVSEGTFFTKMVELVSPKEPLAVICHGDCWTNNILFRYSEDKEVLEVCLLDFQLARYGSPALDLANMIYCCTTREQRSQHLEPLLKFYTDELHERFMLLSDDDTGSYSGSPFDEFVDKEMLYERLKEEFHRCGKFGLGLALDMFPIMTCNSDQAPDLYQAKDQDTAHSCGDNEPVWTSNETCRKKMAELVKELVDNGAL